MTLAAILALADPSQPTEVVTLSPGNWIALSGLILTNLTAIGVVLWRAGASMSRLEHSIATLNQSILSLTQRSVAHDERLEDHAVRLVRIETKTDVHDRNSHRK